LHTIYLSLRGDTETIPAGLYTACVPAEEPRAATDVSFKVGPSTLQDSTTNRRQMAAYLLEKYQELSAGIQRPLAQRGCFD